MEDMDFICNFADLLMWTVIKLLRGVAAGAAAVVVAMLAVASFCGVERAAYTSWPIMAAWGVLAVASSFYIAMRAIRHRMTGWVIAIHASLLVVGIGACVTHFCGEEGTLVVRYESGGADVYLDSNGRFHDIGAMVEFMDAKDYGSCILSVDGRDVELRVNHPVNVGRVRLCIGNVSRAGAVLLVSSDPLGFAISCAGYVLFAVSGLGWLLQGMRRWRRGEGLKRRRMPVIALLIVGALIALRWLGTSRPPMATAGEAMLVCSFGALLVSVSVRAVTVERVAFGIGAVLAVVGVVMLMHSSFPVSLPPALNSGWIVVHVAIVMIAYALFLILGVMGAMQLMGRRPDSITSMRRLCSWSVVLLGIGIFCGAVWANQAWGRYWGWDPKETWALLTFAVYALPLHLKHISSRQLSLYFALAPIVVIITFFGMSFLGPSLHSY